MIEPCRKDDALLEDIAAARTADHVHLWWLGQSGFLFGWRGETLLVDPYLSDSLTRKYAGTSREHVRMTARCIAPERLGFVAWVCSTHAHTDHCDPETLEPLADAPARPQPLRLVLPAANLDAVQARMRDAPIEYHGVDAGDQWTAGPFHLEVFPAAHPTIERDQRGRCRFVGYGIACGPWRIYHSGDTLRHDDLVPALARWKPDVVLLPINGDLPERGVAGNLNGTEAAEVARACGASLIIPHHFDMFAFNTASPDELVAAAARLNQPVRLLRCGERWSTAELPGGPRSAG